MTLMPRNTAIFPLFVAYTRVIKVVPNVDSLKPDLDGVPISWLPKSTNTQFSVARRLQWQLLRIGALTGVTLADAVAGEKFLICSIFTVSRHFCHKRLYLQFYGKLPDFVFAARPIFRLFCFLSLYFLKCRLKASGLPQYLRVFADLREQCCITHHYFANFECLFLLLLFDFINQFPFLQMICQCLPNFPLEFVIRHYRCWRIACIRIPAVSLVMLAPSIRTHYCFNTDNLWGR